MATLKEKRNSPLYLRSLILHGNNKLLDYDNPETGERIRYAQFNQRPIVDCPFRSKGCELVCYATKGNHCFPSVKESREKAHRDSQRADFPEAMEYTIRTEAETKRYADCIMRIRLHESGDFYSLRYLRNWVSIWDKTFDLRDRVKYTFYTKPSPFFLSLTDAEAEVINRGMREGQIAMEFSIDDTMGEAQIALYWECIKRFPMANTYAFPETLAVVKVAYKCDCSNCAKCGECNEAQGKVIGVAIHSASNADMEKYDTLRK